ncbi:MAG: hypothetical protein HC830_01435, partial [Bacteroidetes bacterium]|nr:hypothetical protein [Bacteroidota bacterium]
DANGDILSPYSVGDSLYVEINSLSQEAFDFLTELVIQTDRPGGFGELFSTPIANVPTNLRNANPNGSKAVGFFNVAAVEHSEILEITREQLNEAFDRYKVWERFGRLYLEQIFLYKEQREAALLNQLAPYRYANFLKDHPDWAQRIPLKYIASYLGVNPESLSRIRKKKDLNFY